jgi:hypothetical protein
MGWDTTANADGMNARAGILGGIRSGRSYVISQCDTIGFLLFFTLLYTTFTTSTFIPGTVNSTVSLQRSTPS